ncbi:MAG: hypothetical protein KAH17_06300 [Bacteroidales bacterium]|nr:hypothetical protein [Bacteroidales bacterium]
MKRRFITLALALVVGGGFLSSCQKEEVLSSKKEVLSFIFEASKNVELDQNILGIISGNTISANVPFGTSISNLIPSIEVSPDAQLNPIGGIATDFSSPVSFTVTAEDGTIQVFTTNMAVEAAPYIGTWRSGTIDFGLGLMHVSVCISVEGNICIEFQEMLTGELNSHSLKGSFDPLAKPNAEVELDQTHQWERNQWSEAADQRTVMYYFKSNISSTMHFYYCYCYPMQEWAFEVDLNKI